MKAVHWNPMLSGAHQIWDRKVPSGFSSLMACSYLNLSGGGDQVVVIGAVSVDPYPLTT
jgi:hypothetical protein